MTTTYVTKAGDDVDGILWAELGQTSDALETEFWQLNPQAPGAMQDGAHFPQGVVLTLPDIANQPTVQTVSPWD